MSPKPTTVIVHGAWHQPAHFAPFMQKLEAAGYPCICPQQPTFGLSSEQMRTGPTLQDDAKHLRKVLEQLIEVDEREVVVLMHSYGGVVGTEGVHASLGAKQRRAQGRKGGVVKMVFMCAFLLPPGSSLRDAFGDAPEFLAIEVRWLLLRTRRYHTDSNPARRILHAQKSGIDFLLRPRRADGELLAFVHQAASGKSAAGEADVCCLSAPSIGVSDVYRGRWFECGYPTRHDRGLQSAGSGC